MQIAVICTALLGLLLFGLGLAISMTRTSTRTVHGFKPEPGDPLYKLVRAHGNTAEYAPFLAVLMLYLGAHSPAAWVCWTMIATTACRFLIVAGLLLWPAMNKPNPARFLGALGTYVGGGALCVALLLSL